MRTVRWLVATGLLASATGCVEMNGYPGTSYGGTRSERIGPSAVPLPEGSPFAGTVSMGHPHTPALAKAYGEAWHAHTEELERFCGRFALGYVRADANAPFEQIILKTFRKGRFLA